MFSGAGEQSSTLKEIRLDGKQILLSSMHVKMLVPQNPFEQVNYGDRRRLFLHTDCLCSNHMLYLYPLKINCLLLLLLCRNLVYYYYYYVGIYQKVFWPIVMTSNSFDSHPM